MILDNTSKAMGCLLQVAAGDSAVAEGARLMPLASPDVVSQPLPEEGRFPAAVNAQSRSKLCLSE